MKNNIREILDKTDIYVLDEINILEYIYELEKVKEDYIKSLDKLDVLENRNNKAIEYIEDTPKEDKKIKRIQSCGDNLYSEYIGQWLLHKENYSEYDELLMNKINEIIDRLNGE